MNSLITRYFDAAVADAPAAPPEINPAEFLAKQGMRTDIDTAVDKLPEAKIEIPAPQTPPPAASTEPPAAAPGAPPEVKKEPAGPPPTSTEPAAKEQPAAPDWRKTIKGLPEIEILKELGYDDKLVGLLNRWKSGGSVTEYLQAATVDYTAMNAEDVMKHHMKQKYADLSKEDFEELYRMNVTEHYKLDPDMFTEQEVRRGNILLNAEVKSVRQELIAAQQAYILPKAPETSGPTPEEQQQAEAQEVAQRIAEYRKTIEAHPYVVDVVKNNAITIGEGEEKFNYTTDNPTGLIDLLVDTDKWASKLRNEDGSWNIAKHMLISAIAENDTHFLNELAKHYKAIGARRAIEPIENAVPPGGTPARENETVLSPAAALAKSGVVTSG